VSWRTVITGFDSPEQLASVIADFLDPAQPVNAADIHTETILGQSASADRYHAGLRPPQLCIEPACREQLVMTALLDEPTVVEHENAVGLDDCL